MPDPDKDDAMIDALLADVRRSAPSDVDPALMSRVMADAHRLQGVAAPRPVGIWTQLRDAIGGWPTWGGLAMAGCAGLWIGVAPPLAVETFAAGLIGTSETVSFFGEDEILSTEGTSDG